MRPPSIWVNKLPLLSRLVTRFLLGTARESPASLQFYPFIIGITNIDHLLATTGLVAAAFDLTAAQGNYIAIVTVPTGKRYTLKWFFHATTSSNTAWFYNKSGNRGQLGQYETIDGLSRSAGTFDLILLEGDKLELDSTGNALDGARNCVAIYDSEDAF